MKNIIPDKASASICLHPHTDACQVLRPPPEKHPHMDTFVGICIWMLSYGCGYLHIYPDAFPQPGKASGFGCKKAYEYGFMHLYPDACI